MTISSSATASLHPEALPHVLLKPGSGSLCIKSKPQGKIPQNVVRRCCSRDLTIISSTTVTQPHA